MWGETNMKELITQGARVLVLGSLVCTAAIGFSQQSAAPDNTKSNQQQDATAQQQTNSAADLQMTQQVRKALMQDNSLSTYAHNVKVVTQNGQVTLAGPVRSDAEKQAVEAKAKEVAGKDNVVSQLTVAPDSK
jgi:osmotically-inducible protein OsmY